MTSHKVEADDVCDGPKHRSSCSTVEEDLAAATSRNAISKAPRAAAIAVAISSYGTLHRRRQCNIRACFLMVSRSAESRIRRFMRDRERQAFGLRRGLTRSRINLIELNRGSERRLWGLSRWPLGGHWPWRAGRGIVESHVGTTEQCFMRSEEPAKVLEEG